MLDFNIYLFSLQFAAQLMDMRRERFQARMLQNCYATCSKELYRDVTMIANN